MLQAAGLMGCSYFGLLIGKNGWGYDFGNIGMVVFGNAVLVSNLKIILFSHTFSNGSVIVLLGSIAFYVLNLALVSSFLKSSDSYNTFTSQYGTVIFYLVSVLTVAVTTLIDLALTRY